MLDKNNIMNLPYAWGRPVATGTLRATPEDFQVDEQLAFELSGEGEHVYLLIEKRLLNTQEVVNYLARFVGVKARDIGYAGLKDRVAVTRQWFSVVFPIKSECDWQQLETEHIKLLKQTRHTKKLKIGTLKGNQFHIRITQINGAQSELETKLKQMKDKPVPNYYTEQRFGNHGSNLSKAFALFEGAIKVKNRHLRGLYYSAARSYLFNLILAERVKAVNWHHAIPGDVMQFLDGMSFFAVDTVTADIQARTEAHLISPAGPLWGQGQCYTTNEALAIETRVLQTEQALCQGLIDHQLNLNYRHFCTMAENVRWQWFENNDLLLNFYLKKGSYATAWIRELIHS